MDKSQAAMFLHEYDQWCSQQIFPQSWREDEVAFIAYCAGRDAGLSVGLTDKERLDFLDSKGANWIARDSTTGRGYRVHQDERIGRSGSAREAIDRAMENG
jgi:hypothetical protein